MRYLKNNYKMIYFNQRKIMKENEKMQILSNDYKVKLKKYIAKIPDAILKNVTIFAKLK